MALLLLPDAQSVQFAATMRVITPKVDFDPLNHMGETQKIAALHTISVVFAKCKPLTTIEEWDRQMDAVKADKTTNNFKALRANIIKWINIRDNNNLKSLWPTGITPVWTHVGDGLGPLMLKAFADEYADYHAAINSQVSYSKLFWAHASTELIKNFLTFNLAPVEYLAQTYSLITGDTLAENLLDPRLFKLKIKVRNRAHLVANRLVVTEPDIKRKVKALRPGKYLPANYFLYPGCKTYTERESLVVNFTTKALGFYNLHPAGGNTHGDIIERFNAAITIINLNFLAVRLMDVPAGQTVEEFMRGTDVADGSATGDAFDAAFEAAKTEINKP